MYSFFLCISICFSFFLVRTLSFCLDVHTYKFLCIYFVCVCFCFLLRPNTQFLFVRSYKQVPMYSFCLCLFVCFCSFFVQTLSVTYLNSLPSMTIIKFFLFHPQLRRVKPTLFIKPKKRSMNISGEKKMKRNINEDLRFNVHRRGERS